MQCMLGWPLFQLALVTGWFNPQCYAYATYARRPLHGFLDSSSAISHPRKKDMGSGSKKFDTSMSPEKKQPPVMSAHRLGSICSSNSGVPLTRIYP